MMKLRRLPAQRGVTLIELLIALAIGAIIASALVMVFAQSVTTRERINRESLKIENGRYALDVVADDIRLAGYWGEYSPPVDTQWQTSPDVLPCNTATNILGWEYAELTPKVPVPIEGRDGHTAALDAGALGCLSNLRAGSNILVLRRVSTVGVAPSGTLSGAAYLQNSSKTLEVCGSADPQQFVFSGTAADLTLKHVDCTTTARAREFIVRVYYIATCNDCTAADGIPTLKVAELKKVSGANTMVVRAIAPGIEDFRVIFGQDNVNADGSVDGAYLATDNAGVLESAGQWQNVVAARVFMVARDLEATRGYVNSRTFDLGGVTYTPPAPPASELGDYRREMVSTTVRLVNIAGRRGAP
jgi:type IV pilus assembly protein PilW